MNRLISIVVLLLILAGARHAADTSVAPPSNAPQTTGSYVTSRTTVVKGTVTDRERELVTLAANARVIVQLVELGAEGKEIVLGEQTIAHAGHLIPFVFAIEYDPASITPHGVYVVEGSITVDGRSVYRTTTRSAVITHGHPTMVELILIRSGPWMSPSPAMNSGHLAQFTH
jgi:uncharacterized lipoprotein YbaY